MLSSVDIRQIILIVITQITLHLYVLLGVNREEFLSTSSIQRVGLMYVGPTLAILALRALNISSTVDILCFNP